MIPRDLCTLFWDIDLENFNASEYPDYTIARVLELGDLEAVAWMKQTFSEDDIVRIIRNERRLSRRSANFWALIYDIPADEVAALNQSA